MKLPYSIQGAMFGPALIGLVFMLKITCPASAGTWCFADHFAVPVFMPLLSIYKLMGSTSLVLNHEPVIILLYWALVGSLVGFIFDLYRRPSQY